MSTRRTGPWILGTLTVVVALLALPARAQLVPPAGILNGSPTAANATFPKQNLLGPAGVDYQVNYPYPGQCVADPLNQPLFPTLPLCSAQPATSFSCVSTGDAARTGGNWAACGAPVGFKLLQPVVAASAGAVPAPAIPTPKFVWPVLNPLDYTPDTQSFPGADYYELGLHEATGFQAIADAGLFPNPTLNPVPGMRVPEGMQWTGLVCNVSPGGCSCPPDATLPFAAAYCTLAGKIPPGAPLYTPIWGVGQRNMTGGPVTNTLVGLNLFNRAAQGATPWSANDYVATWPSISIRGTKGKPVVVRWVNEFPDNHVLCPHPDAADWPCAIDRTFMGVLDRQDPALAPTDLPEGVNKFGSPQQPDNSWVTHLHGGEIPPSTDGFAEKWFGNTTTAPLYSRYVMNGTTPVPLARNVNPAFHNPLNIKLFRPTGNADTYTYPMVNEEATIWFHDHTLGKTHHNVIAGPAGFFPVKDPARHGKVALGACQAAPPFTDCDYTWLDPLTEPRNALNVPLYDMFFAIQDRSFNDDGSINFSNGLGQPVAYPALVPGMTSLTPGVNPLVHPTWLPEYFGDHVLVNGVLWPRMPTAPGWYRLRLVDGSDSRCWTIGFSTTQPAVGTKPVNNVNFWVIANDQGYLPKPVLAPGRQLTMCPGERYELLVNFSALPGGAKVAFMTNSAAAPFPAGITPYAVGSPFAEMNVVMRFDVGATGGVKSCGTVGAPASLSWDPALAPAANLATSCIPANPALVNTEPPAAWLAQDLRVNGKLATAVVRQVYLNERLDGLTAAPMGMQLNGVPFEYKVTETPKAGNTEVWKFVNLTVDAHPMHPHLVRHLVVERQRFGVGAYKMALCGSTTCQPGTAPGGEMQVVPDVTGFLTLAPTPVTSASVEGGWKDVVQAPPGMVTTIIAEWKARWNGAHVANPVATAPGTAGCPDGTAGCATGANGQYVYENVWSGPYVWHCHINSHEDSEMMRTSLVVP